MDRKALQLAKLKHQGQKRRNGEPYIVHPIRVAESLTDKGYPDSYHVVGLFHDLLEDTDTTEAEILDIASQEVLDAVRLLTRQKGDDHAKYIKKILENPIAKAVKEQDRIDNLRDCAKLIESNPAFVERYLEDTRKYFLGRFSEELDDTYYEVREKFESSRSGYVYTVYGSMDPEESPLYRSDSNGNAWIYQRGAWVECDPYFWAEIGDDAIQIPEEAANKIVQNKSL